MKASVCCGGRRTGKNWRKSGSLRVGNGKRHRHRARRGRVSFQKSPLAVGGVPVNVAETRGEGKPGGSGTTGFPTSTGQKTTDVKNHEKSENEIIHVRGPGNSAFLIEMLPSKDVYEIRFLLKNFILIKHRCRYEEPGITQFERHGYVLTKPIGDYAAAARRAVVHVKEVEAEDVLELKKTKQLKFLCSPGKIFVTAYKLGLLGYSVDSSGTQYYPKYIVGLRKNDMALCEKFLKVMNQLPNVVCIYDNIRRDLI